MDDYLEAIYFLATPVGEYGPVVGESPVPAARVAEMLQRHAAHRQRDAEAARGGGARSSAGRARRRCSPRRAAPRPSGWSATTAIIERFLTDFMGYSAAESHVHADDIGDAFCDEMVERLAAQLGNPDRCPHGWPVDPSHEQEENRDLRAAQPDRRVGPATIVRLAEHDGDLLHWFYDQGLVPGTEVEVMRVRPRPRAS